MSVENVSSGRRPQGQKASDYDNSDPEPLDKMLFLQQKIQIRHIKGYNFSSVLYLKNITIQHMIKQRKTTMIKHRMHRFKKLKLIKLFCTRVQEIGESLPYATLDNTGCAFTQPQKSMITKWTRDPSIRTSSWKSNHDASFQNKTTQLAQIPEMCMFSTPHPAHVSIVENQRTLRREEVYVAQKPEGFRLIQILQKKSNLRKESFVMIKASSKEPANDPTQKHLKEVKRIFKYLKGTINMGLWYPKDSGFELTVFSDADHAGCLDTRKSTSGGIQFLGDKLVSWMSKENQTAHTNVFAVGRDVRSCKLCSK
ncbi:hypothetical protein Tco_1163449 [Tanacetum coccineum]